MAFRGFFNRYRKEMPLTEVITKDALFLIRKLTLFLKTFKKPSYFFCYPHYPSKRAQIRKMAENLGYIVTNNPAKASKAHAHIYFEYATILKDFDQLKEWANYPWVNKSLRDISKSHICIAFEQVFGYPITVNPITHKGICVKKSNSNAFHDGKIIQCPIPVSSFDHEYVYLKLINNQLDEHQIEDIRVPIFKGAADFGFLKHRQLKDRFMSSSTHTDIIKTSDVLSTEEISNINKFVSLIGLEYGELDVLRDKEDKRIYIVDANNTPHDPRKHLDKNQQNQTLKLYSNAFKRAFLS